MKTLVEAGADVQAQNSEGSQAIHYASTEGDYESLALLLAAGADCNNPNKNGMTPAMLAVQSCNLDTLDLLLDSGAHPDAFDHLGRTALILCVDSFFSDTAPINRVERLTKAGANLNYTNPSQYGYGQGALHLAAKYGHHDAIAILIQAGATVDITDAQQKTPLILAAMQGILASMHGYEDCAEILMRAGASVLHKDSLGKDALDYANLNKYPHLQAMLMARKEAYEFSHGDIVAPSCLPKPLRI